MWGAIASAALPMVGQMLQGGASGAAAVADKKALDKLQKQWNEINDWNAQQVGKMNEANVGYGREILDLGTPDIRASQLGDLMFAQGQEKAGAERDRALKQAMMTNLRRGQGSGNPELITRMADEGAEGLGDARAAATLQGIQGVQPNQAALQTAGNLFRQQAAQKALPGMDMLGGTGGMLGAMGGAAGGMLSGLGGLLKPGGGASMISKSLGF